MAYHESLLHVLGALHKLTAASLGVPSDFFACTTHHVSPRRYCVDYHTIPRYRRTINCHRPSGMENILITPGVLFYTKMSPMSVTSMMVDCRSNCQMETGTQCHHRQVRLSSTLVNCTKYGRMDGFEIVVARAISLATSCCERNFFVSDATINTRQSHYAGMTNNE